jgi:hypothetical protein
MILLVVDVVPHAIMYYDILSCLALSCLALSCLVLSCLVLSDHMISVKYDEQHLLNRTLRMPHRTGRRP